MMSLPAITPPPPSSWNYFTDPSTYCPNPNPNPSPNPNPNYPANLQPRTGAFPYYSGASAGFGGASQYSSRPDYLLPSYMQQHQQQSMTSSGTSDYLSQYATSPLAMFTDITQHIQQQRSQFDFNAYLTERHQLPGQ
jgi:hypothetical protein